MIKGILNIENAPFVNLSPDPGRRPKIKTENDANRDEIQPIPAERYQKQNPENRGNTPRPTPLPKHDIPHHNHRRQQNKRHQWR